MKVLCSAVLIFESIIIVLAMPVAIVVQQVHAGVAILTGAVIIVGCFVALRGLKKPWGVSLGAIMQLVILLTGFVVPTMFFLGLIFAIAWFCAVHFGRKGDAIKAAHSQLVTD